MSIPKPRRVAPEPTPNRSLQRHFDLHPRSPDPKPHHHHDSADARRRLAKAESLRQSLSRQRGVSQHHPSISPIPRRQHTEDTIEFDEEHATAEEELFSDWAAVLEQRKHQHTSRFHNDLRTTSKAVKLLEQLVDPDGKEAAAAAGRGAEHRKLHERLGQLRTENSDLQLAIDQLSRRSLNDDSLAKLSPAKERTSPLRTPMGKNSSFSSEKSDEIATDRMKIKWSLEELIAKVSVELDVAVRLECKPLRLDPDTARMAALLPPPPPTAPASAKESESLTGRTQHWVEHNTRLQTELNKLSIDVRHRLQALEKRVLVDDEQFVSTLRSLSDEIAFVLPVVIPPQLPADDAGWQKWRNELLMELECRGSSEARVQWMVNLLALLDEQIVVEMGGLLEACRPQSDLGEPFVQ